MDSTRSFWVTLPERILALLVLLFGLPTLLIAALAIHISSKGPIFMTAQHATPGQTKVLAVRFRTQGFVGSFLKQFGLDLFPALWNVVRGDLQFRELIKFK